MPITFRLDAITWRVHDLGASLGFYERLGFRIVERSAGEASLTAAASGLSDDAPLLRLEENPAAPLVAGRGAYHVAFNVPERQQLAATLQRIAHEKIPVEGFADHLVSEAIYLPDADGHGLEFTWDRPRDTWQYPGGVLAIGTDPLDLQNLLAELGSEPPIEPHLPAGAFLGHVHLFALDPAEDARWYREHFELAEVMSFGPWGTFLAADGYHHHVGLRRGAGVSDPDHDHGLAWIDARLEPSLFAAIPEPEIGGAKVIRAPSGHRWRVRALAPAVWSGVPAGER
jgi:catechol 2,3-dioxygenase